MNWQTRTYILIFGLALLLSFGVLPATQNEFTIFARLVLGIIAVSLIVFAILAGILAREAILTRKARRLKEEYEIKSAKYRDFQDGFGMLHLLNLDTDIVENLSVNPTSHHNGTWQEPPRTAMMAWFALVSRDKQINQEVVQQQLPAQAELDLLTLIDQYPHVLIYGGTGLGKTSLERMIAYRRKMADNRVLILDTHEHPAKWEGLDRMDTSQKVNAAISALFSLLNKNVEDLRTGQATEDNFEKITVITDEWTEIVSDNDIAKQFIATMVRQSRKYGISLIFATQTNLASDLGLDGRYKTINGFLQLRLTKDSSGRYLAFAHTSTEKLGEFIVPSPLPLPQLVASSDYIPTRLDDILTGEIVEAESTEVILTERQQAILDLWDNGNRDEKFIARQVYNGDGGKQVELVRRILAKCGRTSY